MQRAWITDATDHITGEAVKASATSIVSPGALLMVVRSGILRRAIPVAVDHAPASRNRSSGFQMRSAIWRGFLHFLNERGLPFKAYAQFTKVDLEERGVLYCYQRG